MKRTRRTILALTTLATVLTLAPPARAGRAELPEWVKPAVHFLDAAGYLERDSFHPNWAMPRAEFTRLMKKAFGGGYSRSRGTVTAAEVSAALVRRLGMESVADQLTQTRSPDGWDPGVGPWFGSEIVARELGLRHDRPTTEEAHEASASESMRQADIAWAVWQAKTSPDTYTAGTLSKFGLSNYSESRREVVKFALSLVGTPYVWGGEWPGATPKGYPYGAQSHGGFDCSGFAWYVLRAKTDSWSPNRPYKGWSFPERSSSDMAAATPRRKRLSFDELKPGDVIFFALNGARDPKASDVSHAGIYLGRGWMVHSSGSRAGISLAQVGPSSWWHDNIVWGRRIITTP